MSSLLQEFRFALRSFAKRPAYALVTIGVLAFAIGANTTVFSIFNALLLRPLPYPDDGRLVSVYNSYPRSGPDIAGTSIPDYLDRRAEAPSLADLAILTRSARTLTGDGPAEQLSVIRSSASLFSVLGMAPELGRTFTDAEAMPGDDGVAVISDALWRTHFGGTAAAIGGSLRLDGREFRVIGVMPATFSFPDRNVDVWIPFAFTPAQMSDAERGQEFSLSIGRLAPGATIEGLNAELDAIVKRTAERMPQRAGFMEATGFTGRAESLRAATVGSLAPMLMILQGIVLAVLLIACANVANLQLARMLTRRKELSVRAALGAARSRLVRLVIVESLTLAAVGGAVGLVLASSGIELVRRLGLDPARMSFEFTLDTNVLVFTVVAVVLAALLSSLLPLLSLFREDLARVVQEAGRLGSGGRAAQGFRSALVVVQIAVSAGLLVAAGMLTKSFYNLQSEGAGFATENIWTARIALPDSRYATPEAEARFYERAIEALSALPGVSRVGFTSSLPFSGENPQATFGIEGYVPADGESPPHAQMRSINEGYLPALDIPVIRGRNFKAIETEPVAIVDENLADKYWPDGDALGQRIVGEGTYTIVGVIPAVKHVSLADRATKETIFWHYSQEPTPDGMFALRSMLSPDQLTSLASATVASLDADVPLFDVRSLDARVSSSLGPARAPVVLTLLFAVGAFVLAVVGIYGVLTWVVTQRAGEIGVRIALGAGAADIVQMVLRQGGRLTLIGLCIGGALAVLLGQVLSAQVYEVAAVDPFVFATVLLGLAASAFFASWLPARRAARVDPMVALRRE